jgi:phosphoribosyl-ATP pyrophosphohydrolase/phosphoribosyl-AMP cyclohydrolase
VSETSSERAATSETTAMSATSITPAFDRHELIPAIVQDAASGQVLMLGYMNREAYDRTLAEGKVWFWSRSRQAFWMKGETSGNVLTVRSLRLDCDGDTILVQADAAGPTCHTGATSCFFTSVPSANDAEAVPPAPEQAAELFATIRQRLKERPEGSYIARLAERGIERMAQKVGEEGTEVVIAAVTRNREALISEMADLWFHSYVVLAASGLTPEDVWAELAKRRR